MTGQIHRCSRCGLVGHNVRRCKREPSAVIGPVPSARPPADLRGPVPGAGATEVPVINVDRARADRFAAIEATARARRDRGD